MALYAYELGASVGIIGLVIGLYSLTNTPANILFGRLIDRVGYKIPLIAGLIGDALSMFFYSLCRSPIHLALVRAFHGISGGLVGPATMSITAEYSDRTQRGRAMGIYGMSLATATLVGYGLSGVIASRLGYRALFLIGAGLLAIGAILSLLLPGHKKTGSMTVRTSFSEDFGKARGLLRRKGLIVAYPSIFAQYFAFGGVVSLVLLPSVATFPLLAAVMALYGTAYGVLFPSISALVADYSSPEERGMATGIFHAFLTAGVAIGAPVIGWVGGVVGVESGIMLSSGIMVLALVIALSTLRRA